MRRQSRLQHLFPAELISMVLEEQAAIRREMANRGWRAVWNHVSAVPDVMYPYDPAVLRAIREFDPNVIPLFVRRAYKAPTGEVRIKGYHAIASVRWSPGEQPAAWTRKVLMPTWSNAPQPTHMDLHLEDKASRRGDGLPGGYLPFDFRWYHGLYSAYQEWSAKEAQQWLAQNDSAAKARRAREAAQARVEERHRKDETWLKERIGNIDRHDYEKSMAKLLEPERKIMVTTG